MSELVSIEVKKGLHSWTIEFEANTEWEQLSDGGLFEEPDLRLISLEFEQFPSGNEYPLLKELVLNTIEEKGIDWVDLA